MQLILQCNATCSEPSVMSTLVMPRQTADAQLTFRAETNLKVELEAIAATLDRSAAKLLRDVLAEALPRLRKQAEEEIKSREGLPHGITADALEKALNSLLRKLTQEEPVHLERQDLLTPGSKAIWVLLSYIWGEHPTEEERQIAAESVTTIANLKPVKKVGR